MYPTVIRIFYPNPMPAPPTPANEPMASETIYEDHDCKELFIHDPIYRQLEFVDTKDVRRRVAGLGYIIIERKVTPEDLAKKDPTGMP